ncbi:TetR/AcrR family transcriptional regulator [Rosistilla carotiformis]|nr:TetR family transcriptional regulator [Rosistilla carotiformis]
MMRGNVLREYLVETATTIFYRDGFRATGVDAIAKECNVAKKSLYNHFPSKDLLIAEVLRWRHVAWVESVERTIGAANGPEDAIMELFDATGRAVRTPKYRGCIFFNAAIEFPDACPEIGSIIDENVRYSHRRLVELATEAGLENPELVAIQIGVLRRGAQVTAMASGDADVVGFAKELASQVIADAKRPKSKKRVRRKA